MEFTSTQSILISMAIAIVFFIGMKGYKVSQQNLLAKERNKTAILITVVATLILGTMLFFLLYAWNIDVINIIVTELENLIEYVKEMTGPFINTILILVGGFGLLRIIKIVLRYYQRKSSARNYKRKQTIYKVTQSMVDYTIKIALVLIVLAIWGVNVLPALAGLGILGLVLGFGAQDLMKDIIAGFFIIFEQHFDIGDIVEINGYKGEVIDIGLKTTKVMNWKKDIKIFNNSSVQNMINYSLTESMAIVEVGVSYDTDAETLIQLINQHFTDYIKKNEDVVEDPKCIGIIAFSSSSVDVRVVARTKPEKQYAIERTLRKELKELFDENDIEIPFSQIVIHSKE